VCQPCQLRQNPFALERFRGWAGAAGTIDVVAVSAEAPQQCRLGHQRALRRRLGPTTPIPEASRRLSSHTTNSPDSPAGDSGSRRSSVGDDAAFPVGYYDLQLLALGERALGEGRMVAGAYLIRAAEFVMSADDPRRHCARRTFLDTVLTQCVHSWSVSPDNGSFRSSLSTHSRG
jgi:hypothetical protein